MKVFGTKVKKNIPLVNLSPAELKVVRSEIVVKIAKKQGKVAGLNAEIVDIETKIVELENKIAEIDKKLEE